MRDNVQGRESLKRLVAFYEEHDGKADDFGRLNIVMDALLALDEIPEGKLCLESSPESHVPCHLSKGHDGAHIARRSEFGLSSWANVSHKEYLVERSPHSPGGATSDNLADTQILQSPKSPKSESAGHELSLGERVNALELFVVKLATGYRYDTYVSWGAIDAAVKTYKEARGLGSE
jgi:hypothetical protein